MDSEKLLKLIDAGFTAEELRPLLTKDVTPEDPAPAEPAPAEPTPAETPSFQLPDFEAYTEGISKAIIEAIQKSNVLQSTQKEEVKVSGEEILANVLGLTE